MEDARKIYGDIIDRPHHVSGKRPQMSRLNRAAQFSPFAALTGYEDLVRESARTTGQKIELSEDDVNILNDKLRLLQENLTEHPQISVVYFVPDAFKSGGEYQEIVGRVQKIKPLEQILAMEDGTEIAFDDMISLSGELFRGLDGDSQIAVD